MELISDPVINGITQSCTGSEKQTRPSAANFFHIATFNIAEIFFLKSVWKEMFEPLSQGTNDHSEEWDILKKEMEYLESFVCQDEHRANTWGPRLVKGY